MTFSTRESAYEVLKNRAQERQAQMEEESRKVAKPTPAAGRKRQSMGEAFVKSAARSIGSQVGRQIIRGIMGVPLRRPTLIPCSNWRI